MNLLQILNYITSHPLNYGRKVQAITRFLRWQVGSRLVPYPVIYPFVDGTKLIVKKGMTGATGNIYTGLHELDEMGFLLHFLRKEDLFVDIGANIGSYTILASGVKGSRSMSFEPIPSTYKCLVDNIKLNDLGGRVCAMNVGLGSAKGMLRFTNSLDSLNHVIIDGTLDRAGIDVSVNRLDDVIADAFPALLKIDVEGFELEVLRGSTNILGNDTLKAIIVELNGSGERYGYSDQYVHHLLLEFDFKPYTYSPLDRQLCIHKRKEGVNAIYVRDVDFVKERIAMSKKVRVLHSLI